MFQDQILVYILSYIDRCGFIFSETDFYWGHDSIVTTPLDLQSDWFKIFSFLVGRQDFAREKVVDVKVVQYNINDVIAKIRASHRGIFDNAVALTRRDFWACRSIPETPRLWSENRDNIVLHIRNYSRGDNIIGPGSRPWQVFTENYSPTENKEAYERIASEAIVKMLELLSPSDPVVWVYSTGAHSDFSELMRKIGQRCEARLVLNSYAPDTFLAMVNAVGLVAAHSSFSYNALLLNQGVKMIRGGSRFLLPSDVLQFDVR
jgi:hypothetical protein